MFVAKRTRILLKYAGAWSSRRFYATSTRIGSDDINESDESVSDGEDRDYGGRAFRRHGQLEPMYATADYWLENEGKQFRGPKDGPNWLGGRVPFPMNPSFNPPPPIPNALRDNIFEIYENDPSENLRSLSAKFGISLRRVDAILRLKSLERKWIKENKMLQTGFLQGMERMLGVHQTRPSFDHSRQKSFTADMQNEAVKGRTRDRYQRLYWEPVSEIQKPILPEVLKNRRVAVNTSDLIEKNDIAIRFDKERKTPVKEGGAYRFIDVKEKFFKANLNRSDR